ncbi:MAG: enoyl-CoA hydratase/isomerase family protein, partial [Sphingomonadaceae bacterium]|nr:enoyl-CoA hydratase/isomerase family protein [Sphingomonadaceae bacterium]
MAHDFENVTLDVSDEIATITLNRPHRLNAFNRPMAYEFEKIWDLIRDDPAVRAVVLQSNGDRAFSTGLDTRDGGWLEEPSVFGKVDPSEFLCPKTCNVWKPFIVAAHGMFAAGAFYWLNEADIVICSEDATFFEPHLTHGLVCALEPIGLMGRIGLGEILRMVLMGNDERVSAQTALQIGLVSEVVENDQLRARARQIAAKIAEKPASSVEGSLKAIWRALDKSRS